MYRLNFCTPIPGLQPARGVQALFVKREAKQNILLNAFEGDTQLFLDLTSNEKEKTSLGTLSCSKRSQLKFRNQHNKTKPIVRPAVPLLHSTVI